MDKVKYKKVLLINCALDKLSRKKIRQAVSSPSLGLLSIASVLLMHGYEVKIIDFFVEHLSPEKFCNILREYKPDIIGCSVYTRTMPFLYNILKIISSIDYRGKVVVGGPHPTFAVQEMLNHKRIDYVLSGEGEFGFIKLLESLNSEGKYPIEQVEGLNYNKSGKIVKNRKSGKIECLDALPLQPVEFIMDSYYSAPFTLITSRGCPGDCIYCASRALSGKRYRMKSAENIICEMFYIKKKLGSERVTILDDTFTADVDRFEKFARLLKKSKNHFQYRIESRGDVLSERLLDQLKETNCQVIHVGVESGSQQVLNKIGKKVNLERTVRLLEYGQSIGIHMVASFIIGHYCDTEITVQETFNLMKDLKEKGIEISVAVCTPFPGTPIYEHAERLGIVIHAKTWQEYDFGNVIISTQYLSQESLRKLLFEAIEICS